MFPFIATCLATGTALNDDISHASNVQLLPIDIAYDGCENDDGVSFFDVSQPANACYGVMFIGEKEVNWQIKQHVDRMGELEYDFEPDYIPGRTILDPRTYIRRYYDDT